MQLYFAPMEGVTPWHYRQTHAALFGGVDCYYTPFLNPTEAGLAGKALQEVLPEHNRGVNTVPQILTNNAERFVLACQTLAELGYTEVDLNLGCPSGTVVAKGRGAGFLAPSRREQLEAFLEEIFAKSPLRISLKTRLGMESPEELPNCWHCIIAIPPRSSPFMPACGRITTSAPCAGMPLPRHWRAAACRCATTAIFLPPRTTAAFAALFRRCSA